jgi:hypothetical protein
MGYQQLALHQEDVGFDVAGFLAISHIKGYRLHIVIMRKNGRCRVTLGVTSRKGTYVQQEAHEESHHSNRIR